MIAPPPSRDDAAGPAVNRRRVAVDGRRVEIWTARTAGLSPSITGSRLAERLAAEVLGVSPSSLRVATLSPSGRPVVLVAGEAAGCGISISHTQRRTACGASIGLVAVAACRDGQVGVDIVSPADVSPEPLARFVASDDPRSAIDPWHVSLEWAAKEAAYKTSAIDEAFRPHRVVVERLADDGFRWRVSGLFRAVHGAGRFIVEDDHVVAVAVADHIPCPSPGASEQP